MGESIWTTVTAKIPGSWVSPHAEDAKVTYRGDWLSSRLPPVLAGLAEYLGESMDLWFGAIGSDAEQTPDCVAYVQFQGESNYGVLGIEDWLGDLEELRIPCEVIQDAKYEWPETWTLFATSLLFAQTFTHEGDGMSHGALREIAEGKHAWAKTPEEFFTKRPTLEGCSIYHLMGLPPPNGEGEDDA